MGMKANTVRESAGPLLVGFGSGLLVGLLAQEPLAEFKILALAVCLVTIGAGKMFWRSQSNTHSKSSS